MKKNQKIGLKRGAVKPLRSRFFLSTGIDDPSPPRCAPGHVEPLPSRFFLSTATDAPLPPPTNPPPPPPPRCAPGHVKSLRSRFVGQPGPALVPSYWSRVLNRD